MNPSYATPIGLLLYGKDFRVVESGSFIDSALGNMSFKSVSDLPTKFRKLLKKFLP